MEKRENPDNTVNIQEIKDIAEDMGETLKKLDIYKKAETTQEFKAKYGRKRFSSATAGKQLIIAYLYLCYQMEEGIPEKKQKSLYRASFDQIAEKVDKSSKTDIVRFATADALLTWIRTAQKAAVMARDALNSLVLSVTVLSSSFVLCAHTLINHGLDTAKDPSSLQDAMINVINTTGETVSYTMERLSECYNQVNGYNNFIAIIAEELNIPELTILQVYTEETNKLIKDLNASLTNYFKLVCEKKEELSFYDSAMKLLADPSILSENPQILPLFPNQFDEKKTKVIRDQVYRCYNRGELDWAGIMWRYVLNG